MYDGAVGPTHGKLTAVTDEREAADVANGPDVAVRLEAAAQLAEARGATAQLCVLRDGRVVLDRCFGRTPDALFWTFSAGKPFIALTIRQVLAHRSGLYSARGMPGDALAMTDWDRSVRRIERAALSFPPGQVPAYQPVPRTARRLTLDA